MAKSALAIYVGRIIGGICIGASTLLAFVYVGEVSDSRHRGALGSMLIFFLTTGITYVLTLGKFLPWEMTCIACAIPPNNFLHHFADCSRLSLFSYAAERDGGGRQGHQVVPKWG